MLLTREERFKKIVLKCEDYHVLVKVENLPKLVSLFKEFGYNVDEGQRVTINYNNINYNNINY